MRVLSKNVSVPPRATYDIELFNNLDEVVSPHAPPLADATVQMFKRPHLYIERGQPKRDVWQSPVDFACRYQSFEMENSCGQIHSLVLVVDEENPARGKITGRVVPSGPFADMLESALDEGYCVLKLRCLTAPHAPGVIPAIVKFITWDLTPE